MTTLSQTVKVAGREIGVNQPCYFMAEIAGNFSNEQEAVRIVDAAVRAGADAIKFQTLDPETITTKSNRFDMAAVGNQLQYEVFADSMTPAELQLFLVDYCRSKGIPAFSAPSHLQDLELMAKFGSPAYKIGSDLATHLPLLREVAKTGKPIFLSTGMCTLAEVETSVEAILAAGNDQVLLFQCVANYPGKPEEQNLRAMLNMKERFACPTGFSDHTVGIDVSCAAIALGADMIERHFWVAGNVEGPDRGISSDETEFAHLVGASKRIRDSLGDGIKRPTLHEQRNMTTNRVSIIVMEDVPTGRVLKESMLDIRRPGYGLPPKMWERVIGRKVVADIRAEEPLQSKHLDW